MSALRTPRAQHFFRMESVQTIPAENKCKKRAIEPQKVENADRYKYLLVCKIGCVREANDASNTKQISTYQIDTAITPFETTMLVGLGIHLFSPSREYKFL